MLKSIRTWFGGRQAATPAASDELPAEVATVIAGASFLDRGADDEGNPRLVITLAGGGGFRYSRDDAAAWLKRAWPSLNEAQTARAVKLLASRVAEINRLPVASERSGERWSDWKPLRAPSIEV
ncbi:hypothetical protein [Burkholderia pseudomallei]|uniref:hypothetical protein n=1 Tax=Burkholderia pseudomallei TaxID=28450 RepID=UPI0021F71745|nr:hypothetical protein [Burkholderia pseudomallei]MCW0101050.1 hypothetical protein [Burkholderia pseudomallei]